MHYNLHERLRPKKYVPYRKMIVISVFVLVAIIIYLVFLRGSGPAAVPAVRQPA